MADVQVQEIDLLMHDTESLEDLIVARLMNYSFDDIAIILAAKDPYSYLNIEPDQVKETFNFVRYTPHRRNPYPTLSREF